MGTNGILFNNKTLELLFYYVGLETLERKGSIIAYVANLKPFYSDILISFSFAHLKKLNQLPF